MIIIWGTINLGKLFMYRGQGISTKFFYLMLPLFPVGSYLMVGKDRGIEIPFNGQSIWMGYSRTTFLVIGLICLYFGNQNGSYSDEPDFFNYIGLPLVINGVVAWLKGMLRPKNETLVRDILDTNVDLNLLPNQLPLNLRTAVYQKLHILYAQKHGENAKWFNDINKRELQTDSNNKDLWIALSCYEKEMQPDNPQFEMIYDALMEKYHNVVKKVDRKKVV